MPLILAHKLKWKYRNNTNKRLSVSFSLAEKVLRVKLVIAPFCKPNIHNHTRRRFFGQRTLAAETIRDHMCLRMVMESDRKYFSPFVEAVNMLGSDWIVSEVVLFFLSVAASRRWKTSSEQRDHRSQQPPDGGEAHHREAARGQCELRPGLRFQQMLFLSWYYLRTDDYYTL